MTMKKRVNITKNSTVGIIAAMVLLALFLVIATAVIQDKTIHWDTAVLIAINNESHSTANIFFLAVTHLGDIATIIAGAALLAAILTKQSRFFEIPFVIATIGGTIALNAMLKLLFQRERPELWELLTHESTYSFPSGHALITSAFVVLVMGLLWNTKWRIAALLLGVLFAVIIGFSRLYLGVHYPSDVLAGWCLGVAWGIVMLVVMNEGLRRASRSQDS